MSVRRDRLLKTKLSSASVAERAEHRFVVISVNVYDTVCGAVRLSAKDYCDSNSEL